MTTPYKIKARIHEQKIQNTGNFSTDSTAEQEENCVVLLGGLRAFLITTASNPCVNNTNAHYLLLIHSHT
jgi:hypothetical protein